MFAPFQTGDRSSINDRASLLQIRQRGLSHQEIAIDVCLEGSIPLLFGELTESFLVLLVGGIIHKDVELAQLGNCSLDRATREPRILNVTGNRNTRTSLFLYFLNRFTRIAF